MKKSVRFFIARFLLLTSSVGFFPLHSAQAAPAILFPVIGSTNYSNDFGAPRTGHTHQGNDIFGRKGQPLIAVMDGTVEWVTTPRKGSGMQFSIQSADGWSFWYIHVNNDTPGTDDGSSRGIFGYAPDLYRGMPVVAGQLLGWMGDSGNAESTPPHLHFEMHPPTGGVVNPFNSLQVARRISKPVIPPAAPNEILPYGQFTGGGAVALGNVDASTPEKEIVVGAGAGGGPQVRVYSEAGVLYSQFFAFPQTYKGGLDVATGDVDGDGTEEIIVASGPGSITQVMVYTPAGQLLTNFFPYTEKFTKGANVTAADLNGDGRAEIITGPRYGGGPHVRIFDGQTGAVLSQFFTYDEKFHAGIDVAATAATATRPSLIITTPLGGGPNVRIFNGNDNSLVGWFFAGDPRARTGIRVSIADVDTSTPDPEIVTIPYVRRAPTATMYDLLGNQVSTFDFLEPWWEGGYDLAAESGGVIGVTAIPFLTRRRTTVRWLYGPPSTTNNQYDNWWGY